MLQTELSSKKAHGRFFGSVGLVPKLTIVSTCLPDLKGFLLILITLSPIFMMFDLRIQI